MNDGVTNALFRMNCSASACRTFGTVENRMPS
jgi:hypothetical protein